MRSAKPARGQVQGTACRDRAVMRRYVSPLIQSGQVGNMHGVGRIGGHKVEMKPETLEIFPDGVQVGVAVVEFAVGASCSTAITPIESKAAAMDTVYVETTIVGHLVGRTHPDPIVAARQTSTRTWWSGDATSYQLYISQLVLDECGDGDPTAAVERMVAIQSLDMLTVSAAVDSLAKSLIARKAVPTSEPRDAFHIAIAAINGVKYLLTWNFKHIANAALRGRIEQVCRDAGYEPPIICTPDELMGTDDGS